MAISKRAEKKLDEMMQSGSSETMGVADILQTISENGGMQETNAYLCVCAQEIIDAAQSFIEAVERRDYVAR